MMEDHDRREVRKLYEKALASGLGSYVHLEDLAKRFSFTDLKLLLEGEDRLKRTYLYTKTRILRAAKNSDVGSKQAS